MKLTLMIEGDAPALARILASLDGSGATATLGTAPNALPAPMAMPAVPPVNDADDGPANLNAPAVDTAGLPWDERIHAKTKATIGDGTWRKKRGVDDATVNAVETELRARAGSSMPAMPPVGQPAPIPMPMPPVANAQPMPAPMAMPVMPPPFDPAAAPMAMPLGGAPAVMASPVAAAAPVYSPPVAEPVQSAGPMDFAQFMQHLQGQMTKTDATGMPLIHADYLAGLTQQIATAFGSTLNSFTDISTQPNMIAYAVQLLQRDDRW